MNYRLTQDDKSIIVTFIGIVVFGITLVYLIMHYGQQIDIHNATTSTEPIKTATYTHHAEYVGELDRCKLYYVTILKEDSTGPHVLDHATVYNCVGINNEQK